MIDNKLDIFDVLESLDRRNFRVYDSVRGDEELRKELDKNICWLIPQWMVGAYKDSEHSDLVQNFNDVCNPGWYSFYGHPELQAKLLACCGLGYKTRHRFIKPVVSRESKKIHDLLLGKYYDITPEEVELWCRSNDIKGLEELAQQLGLQEVEIGELRKIFRTKKGYRKKK